MCVHGARVCWGYVCVEWIGKGEWLEMASAGNLSIFSTNSSENVRAWALYTYLLRTKQALRFITEHVILGQNS